MGRPRPLFRLFSSFQTNITMLTTNVCEKRHSVDSAGIQTHNLLNTSLLPLPIDQAFMFLVSLAQDLLTLSFFCKMFPINLDNDDTKI